MRVLVTGANGFLGSYLCSAISQADGKNEVLAVVRGEPGARPSVLAHLPNLRSCYADLAQGLHVAEPIDVIVHAAGRTPVPGVEVTDFVRNNIIATQNLVEFAVRKQVKVFVYLSALSVYGRVESMVVDESTPMTDPTPYGITKYIGELLLKDKQDVLRSIAIRLPLVMGIGMSTGWLYGAYEASKRGEAIRIYNGDSPYNMVHVSDVCDLVLSSLNSDFPGHCAFTVGCDNHMSVREIVTAITRHVGSTSPIMEESTATKGFRVSSEKARRLLAFRPKAANEILDFFLEEATLASGAMTPCQK
ncbi:MAG: NAD(P)-dependent oxidoreductase [Chloroflexi bacterium]|nr:NAD(P)-dependent oxidoreductase [Chloroflexota bacterium]